MYRHGPACLENPVSQAEPWVFPEAERSGDMRGELVERVRQEIAAGTYETPERWEAALDRLGQRLGLS